MRSYSPLALLFNAAKDELLTLRRRMACGVDGDFALHLAEVSLNEALPTAAAAGGREVQPIPFDWQGAMMSIAQAFEKALCHVQDEQEKAKVRVEFFNRCRRLFRFTPTD